LLPETRRNSNTRTTLLLFGSSQRALQVEVDAERENCRLIAAGVADPGEARRLWW
jgi:hypothetical protein